MPASGLNSKHTGTAVRCVLALLFLGTVAFNVYRAYTQSLTVDEALTYNNFVAPHLKDAFAYYDANNHVLNTLLCRLAVKSLGASELVLRLPSLFGGALYLFMVAWLCERMFGAALQAILSFVVLAANPIVLDYLSAARGYSLGLGFEFLAILLIVSSLSSASPENRRNRNVAIGIALALSSAGNLVFAIPNSVLVAVHVFLFASSLPKPRFRRVLLSSFEIAAPGLAVFALLMYVPLSHAGASTFYIGEASFLRSAEIFLVRSFNYPTFFWDLGHRLADPLRWMTGPAIALAALLLAIIAFRRKTQPWPSLLIAPLMLVGSLATLVMLHVLIGLPFPYERTGLYFIPLATLTVLEAAVYGARLHILRIPAILLYLYLLCVMLQYFLELKTDRYEEWWFDAGTKRVVTLLASMHQSGGKRLAVSWEYDQSVNYYRKILRLDWLAPVDRTDPHASGFDYYYLEPGDRPIVDALKLKVLYTDPVTQAVLAAP